MTDVLTVPTHFGDISELSTGLADRVDEERLILYGPTAYEEGATVGFSVLLVDGSPALEGVGRVTAAVDGGEDRAPETRFDIVFDSLQLEGMSEVVYERIVMARMSMIGDEPATGEVDLSELEAEAAPAEVAAPEPQGSDWEGDAETAVADPEQIAALADQTADHEAVDFDAGGATVVADVSALEGPPAGDDGMDERAGDVDLAAEVDVADVADVAAVDMGELSEIEMLEADATHAYPGVDGAGDALEESDGEPQSLPVSAGDSLGPPPEDPPIAPSPELPPAPAGFQLPPFGGRLTRPAFPPTWHPMAAEPPPPSESTGFFLYPPNELPVPPSAPRPDIDPSLRVQPAPRPGATASAGTVESLGDSDAERPQIPLPDEDSDVAPAVEPDSFALGEEVSFEGPESTEDAAMAVDDEATAGEGMDASDEESAYDAGLDGDAVAFDDEAIADEGMDASDEESAHDVGLDGDAIAFDDDD